MTLEADRDCVALLHGLGRTAKSFYVLERALRRQGFDVINTTYPSKHHKIGHLAETHFPRLLDQCRGRKVHFVTHSLGGVLLRLWLRDHRIENLGRSVMLAPPNGGSELVDALADLPPFEWITGPAGPQLSTAKDALPSQLGPAEFEVGIIAGVRRVNPLAQLFFAAENDGKVSVDSTHLEGMRDHLVLPVTHTFLMNNPLVIAQILQFLRNGKFDPGLKLLDAARQMTARVTGQS